jgi:hypothetical protein
MTLRRMDNVLIVVTLADAGRPRSLCDSACSAGSLWPSLITRTNRFTNVGRSCGPAGIATVPPCPFVEHSQGRRLRSGTPSTQRTRANQSPRPVSGRIGSHRNGAGATTLSRSISTRRRFEPQVLENGDQVLTQPERVPQESAQSQLPSSGSIRPSSVRYACARDLRRLVAYSPSSRLREGSKKAYNRKKSKNDGQSS